MPAWGRALLLALGLACATPLAAQEIAPDPAPLTGPAAVQPEAPDADGFPMGAVAPPPPTVLIVNLERIFAESLFGQRVRDDLGEAQAALIAENAQIQEQLQAEERSLAERRPTMEVDAFRAEADAFDTRVQAIRREQDAKEVALQDVVDAGRADFSAAVEPVIARLMVARGATVVLYHTSVYVAVASVDITDEAIAALDQTIGDGTGLELDSSLPAPDPAPEGLPLAPDDAPATP